MPVNESIFDMLQKVKIYFRNNTKPPVFCDVQTQCLAIAEKYEKEAAAVTSLMPGALEALKELTKMNLKLGLCTLSNKMTADYILNRFKIREYFQAIVTRDEVKRVKPDTEQLELALKTLAVPSDAAVVVGDSIIDMQSAKDLKVLAIGLPTGISTKEQLIKNGANYILTSLVELPSLITKIA
ncbi:MAG: HAD family hydrolase [Nitrososphaerota archaeon]|nr:HAD family hydrolase [Nitrososphaerota archaeon]